MPEVFVSIIISVVFVSLVSFIGIITLAVSRKFLERALAVIVGLGAGTMIGISVFELVPESLQAGGQASGGLIIGGMFMFFIIEKFIHWRHHHHHQDHAHHHEGKIKPFAYLNLIGEALHNFLDGTIIAASYLIDFNLGVASTTAIVLHEMPQEIGDFGILVHGGFPVKRALIYNFLVALTAVAGAVMVFLLSSAISEMTYIFLSIAGGGFLYIALSSLLPEIGREESKKKFAASFAFMIIGVFLVYYLGVVFPE